MSDLTTLTTHKIGQFVGGIWSQIVDLGEQVGRLSVQIGRAVATVESRDEDLEQFFGKYLADADTTKRDEYTRGGRVVLALERLGVAVGDVSIHTVVSLHKCLTYRVPAESDKTGSVHDLNLWAKGKYPAKVWTELSDSDRLLLFIWTTATKRGKTYPTKTACDDAMSAFGVFGSRGGRGNGGNAGNSGDSDAGSADGGNAGNSANTDNSTTAPADPGTPVLSETDLAAVAREVGKVFGRFGSPENRATFGKYAVPVLELADKYGCEAVIALVKSEVQTAEAEIETAKNNPEPTPEPTPTPRKRATKNSTTATPTATPRKRKSRAKTAN